MDRSAVPRLVVPISVLLVAGSLLWAGKHAWQKSDDLMRRAVESAAFVRGVDPYFIPDMTYPPTSLPILAPLVAPFGPRTLRAVWLVLNLAALAVVCRTAIALWGRTWPRGLAALFCLALAASKPVRLGIGLGQFHLIPTALLLLALLAIRRGRPGLAGLFVGLALAKPTMVLPFLGYLAVRRQARTLVVALGFQGLLLGGVSAWLGVGPIRLIREWLRVARSQLAAGMIDLPSLVQGAWPEASGAAGFLALAVLLIGLAATVTLRERSDLGLFSLCAFVSCIFTYHRPYDLVLLVIPLAYFIERGQSAPPIPARWARWAAIGLGILLILPNNPVAVGPLVRWYGTLERGYSLGFVALSYVFLVAEVALLTTERPRSRPGSFGVQFYDRGEREPAQLASASS